MRSFKDIRRAAPAIHVFKPANEHDKEGVITMLEPYSHDGKYENYRYSEGTRMTGDYINGSGSRMDPYTYLGAAPVSVHYAVIDLWSRFCESKGPVFIEVNGWFLEVTSEGVIASDGYFTKLS